MGESAAATEAVSEVVSELWMSKKDVCAALKVGERKVERLAASGEIRKVAIPRGDGRSYDSPVYDPESVKAYLEKTPTRRQLARALQLQRQEPEPEQVQEEQVQEEAVSELDFVPRYAYLTLREAAELVRMPVSWVREAIDSGRLPFERTAVGSWRVRRADIEDMPASMRKR